jgi:hypothetical protein
MKSLRSSVDPKRRTTRPRDGRRKQEHFAKDGDKWLISSATTTLHVAVPNEWLSEMAARKNANSR